MFCDTFVEAAPQAAAAAERLLVLLSRHGRAHQQYPFGNPVSIERRHMERIKETPYCVAEKTDGVRAALVATTDANSTPVCVLWDRCGRSYGMPVRADAAFFLGGVYDCEVVKSSAEPGVVKVLIFDAAMLDGSVDVSGLPYTRRIEALQAVFPSGNGPADKAGLTLSALPHVRISVKRVYRLQDLAACVAESQRLGHPSDGYVLTPDDGPPSAPGTAWNILKVKDCHTADFLWSQGNVWYLNGPDTQMVTEDGTAELPGMRLCVCDRLKATPYNTIVEMRPVISPHDGRISLVFEHARPDRDVPNNLLCVQRTIVSARQGVSIQELM